MEDHRRQVRGSLERCAAFTLVELMIALAISTMLIAAALAMHAHARNVYRTNERIARLQEQGRYALSVLEPDIEMAGYLGFTNVPDGIRLVRGAQPQVSLATLAELRQFPARAGDALPAAVPGLPPNAHACGVNFAVDLSMPVQGADGVFATGRKPSAACAPYQNRARVGADTLTLRRVSTRTTFAEPDRIQIYASRFSGGAAHLLFADGTAPGPVDANHRIHDLLVRTYYIAQDSVGQPGVPALRVKSLTRSGTQATFADEEVMHGVEDLQIQFAVTQGQGGATRYVNPDHPDLLRLQVMAVRVWLRVRAEEPDAQFTDHQTYRYANVEFTPTGAERNYRRVLISRTIAVRNARTF